MANFRNQILGAPFQVATAITPVGSELVTNGHMEADDNWANYNTPTTNAQSSTQAKGGTHSRKFVADSTYDGIKSDTFTTVADVTYTLSAWVYADDGNKVHIQLLDGDGSSGTCTNQNRNHAVTQDTWTYLEFDICISTGGANSRVTFQSASGAATGTWYIDKVSLRKKSTSSVYITSIHNGTDTAITPGVAFSSSSDDIILGKNASLKFIPPIKCVSGETVTPSAGVTVGYFIAA